MMKETNTLIIGASVSGLACASTLQKKNIEYLIIDKEDQVAAAWRNHDDRLHLHTNKGLSNLPYKKFDSNVPRHSSRQQVVDYLVDYQKGFNIKPILLQKQNQANHKWFVDNDATHYAQVCV